MPDVAAALAERFRAAMERALGPEVAGADPVVRRAQQEKFGDFQANFAMGLGKQLGRPPRDVATEVVAALEVDDMVERTEVAGPGFVNVWLRNEWLAAALVGDERLGVARVGTPETVVIDYSSPTITKEMQAHHLRTTVIGDALVRVFDFVGHKVIRQNHIGDWGTNWGFLIEFVVDLGDDAARERLADMTALYLDANTRYKEDPEFATRARQRVLKLQEGDPETVERWRLLIDTVIEHCRVIYERLDITLTDDDLAPESFYNQWLEDVCQELIDKGLAVVNEGALCVFPPGFKGREDRPLPMIIRKSDGGYGYETTDLAALRYRTQTLHANRILYVVGAEQTLRLSMLFAAGELAGWSNGVATAHVAHGLMLGGEGTRFATRGGDSFSLRDLIDEAVERATAVVEEKSSDLPADERAAVAHAVGVGAVKYADLANDRVKDYQFDWDRMLAMDGNTGPYLQYARARICSIFRRAGSEGSGSGDVLISEAATEGAAERALVMELLGFEPAVRDVIDHLQPHRLCTYLFGLASAFTTFYEHCPVLAAPTPEQRASRLRLCEHTATTLSLGLSLLGITSPDRM